MTGSTKQCKREIAEYLDELAENGQIKIEGTGPYSAITMVEEMFGLSANEARRWVMYWMSDNNLV